MAVAAGRGRRWLALGLACGVLGVGCSTGGSSSDEVEADANGRDGGLETPTFAEGEAGVVVSTSIGEASSETTTTAPAGSAASTSTIAGAAAAVTTSSTLRTVSVGFDDPIGDATSGIGTSAPPPWSDLAGASLERRGNAYRLNVRLGGEAPHKAPGQETMNIASYYDTDGDGVVDRELWVNVGPNGWGPTWYDDQGNAFPGESSNTKVVVKGNEVQLLFPDVMLDSPDRLRFSVASEYGPLSTIGTGSARRDDAPDGDRAVSFPPD